jgi:hypothetical protein
MEVIRAAMTTGRVRFLFPGHGFLQIHFSAQIFDRLQRSAIKRIFSRISRHCVTFPTKTFLRGASREKLIEEMSYRNTHAFDNQKYKCLEQARKQFNNG